MSFRAPVEDILFAISQALLGERGGRGFPMADGETESILSEAARFADEKLAPLNRVGDRQAARMIDGAVATPPGWRDAYALWRAGGWAGLAAPEGFGGSGLSRLLLAGALDAWNGANMAFMLGPLLCFAAVDALAAHAEPMLQDLYLRRIVSGEWMATMNLTEPQAGSDLSQVRMRAVPSDGGSWRLFGQKIFITYGEHDLTDNIIHLVLARIPEAPEGTRGISLFLAPKILTDREGRPIGRNDLRCLGLERKLGIHGAPTCTMAFGESEGAQAWLVGEANRGLACMFTMMNAARLAVGLQGVGICEAAGQASLAFARERRQGRARGGHAPSPIVAHPDVRRMLMTIKALTAASRAICYRTAAALDAGEAESPGQEAAARRAALLTPVAKAFSTDAAIEAASLAVQVHGGMGYVEETGVAQLLRDGRISAIYEGTNGIQAIDLVQRKLPLDGGESARLEMVAMRAALAEAARAGNLSSSRLSRLNGAVDALEAATVWMLKELQADRLESALAGAAPYLRLFGLARGGASLALDATVEDPRWMAGRESRIALACFFADHLAPASGGLRASVMDGGGSILSCGAALGEEE